MEKLTQRAINKLKADFENVYLGCQPTFWYHYHQRLGKLNLRLKGIRRLKIGTGGFTLEAIYLRGPV